jgi:probable HAF family extracellular repeat protein
MKRLVLAVAVLSLSTGWTIRSLGTLPGGGLSVAWGVNITGETVGQAMSSGGVMRAVFWNKAGAITEIPTPVIPGRFSVAYDINNLGWVVGRMATPTSDPRAFKWRPGSAVIDLGASSASIANGINEANHIAGQWTVAGTPPRHYAVVWPGGAPGTPFWLGGFGGYIDIATDVASDAPVATGMAATAARQRHAFLYIDGAGPLRDLGTLGGDESFGRSVSVGMWPDPAEETIYVVGSSETIPGDIYHTDAFLYHRGTMANIGGLPGCTQNTAYAINKRKEIVGTSWCDGFSRAWLWRDGVMFDLFSLLPPGTGWEGLGVAYDINENGWIVGYGTYLGQGRAFLMKP